jgi:hypothetical protein
MEENRCQILVSSILGFLVYLISKNELIAAVFVLVLSYILRVCNFDKWINNYISKIQNKAD